MKKRNNRKLLVLLFVTIVLLTILNKMFFFNIFTFRGNPFTSDHYTSYMNPATYSISNSNGVHFVDIKNDDDIEFIFEELQKCELIGFSDEANLEDVEGWFTINFTHYTNSKKRIHTANMIKWYGEESSFISSKGLWEEGNTIHTDAYLEMTKELKEYFIEKFSELEMQN